MAYAMIDIEAALGKAVEHLGYELLSLEQCGAIMHFVAGPDVFVPIPTGAGNFFCHPFPLPIVFDFLLRHLTREVRLRTGSSQLSIVVAQDFHMSSKAPLCEFVNCITATCSCKPNSCDIDV